jgi:hypothetical protein
MKWWTSVHIVTPSSSCASDSHVSIPLSVLWLWNQDTDTLANYREPKHGTDNEADNTGILLADDHRCVSPPKCSAVVYGAQKVLDLLSRF